MYRIFIAFLQDLVSWICQSEEVRWNIQGADDWFQIGEDHKNDNDDDDDDYDDEEDGNGDIDDIDDNDDGK